MFVARPTQASNRFIAHLFELATAVAYVIVGVAYLLDDHTNLRLGPLSPGVGDWAYVFSGLEATGGPLVVVGVLAARAPLRGAGLALLGAGLIMHFVASLVGGVQPRDFVPLVFAASCWLRLWFLLLLANRGIA